MSRRIVTAMAISCFLIYGCAGQPSESTTQDVSEAGDAGPAEAEEPGAIARVATWEELRKQPAFDLGDGVTVRFGVEARACPVWSGILLYAFTEGYDDLVPKKSNRDRLGPCWVSVT